jgi:hypothetical protein
MYLCIASWSPQDDLYLEILLNFDNAFLNFFKKKMYIPIIQTCPYEKTWSIACKREKSEREDFFLIFVRSVRLNNLAYRAYLSEIFFFR